MEKEFPQEWERGFEHWWEDKSSLHRTESALGVCLSNKKSSNRGMQNPHVIWTTFQCVRALKLQARFTSQPAECGRWKAGAHLHSHMCMAKINPSLLSLSTRAIYYCGQGSQESAFCFFFFGGVGVEIMFCTGMLTTVPEILLLNGFL